MEYTGEHFKITTNRQLDEFAVADFRKYADGQVFISIETLDGQNISKLDLQIKNIVNSSIDNLSLSSGTKSYDSNTKVLTITNVNANYVQITLTEGDQYGYVTISSVTYYYEESAAVEVTTNAAEEGATFTEATFEMPAFDATAEYELVRDMGYKVAFSGVPTRARLAKDGNGKFPAPRQHRCRQS